MAKLAKILILGVSLVGLAACGDDAGQQNAQTQTPPSVVVKTVEAQDVSTTIEYVGKTAASQQVDVRARVNGTLLVRPFREGTNVKAGELLFSIDPAEFEANVALAKAEVAKAEANVVETRANRERYKVLVKRQAASQAKLDEAEALYQNAVAQREGAKAQLQKAALDLDYTQIASPLDGRAGLAKVDEGNLIGPDSGILVSVIKLDPVNVLFSISEREYLGFATQGRGQAQAAFTPRIRLADDTIYLHDGEIDLIDNKVDPATGTINIRLRFPNPDELLFPGQFVNVILVSSNPVQKVVAPQAAVQENQSGAFVLVVDQENKVTSRPIQTGETFGASVVVEEGLAAGERIVVEGIQKVRPGAAVTPVESGS
ncbi:efflux RND transporter periplasmic adaptor subunit [Nisaea acidiphila]|uniref:Efflux RND transporter periplasmic adaptor subunit n=1 Tax=Nisaea acidiphila TaxID=1862145 RepID=A0A9J7AV37_9PROT|nr:efflux RND transporter periplasmic adaptor subunit [Nisaea acidiphila]UUX51192.1 efflux RND transporter periplasmic adaptor subunit [Nisaea acidiphila]